MLKVTLDDREVRRILQAMAGVQGELENLFGEGITGAVRYMQFYPAKPAHSTYIREGKYGQAWEIRDIARGAASFGVEAVNTRDYGVWVGGAETQRDYHAQTGWHRDVDAVKLARDGMVAKMAAAVLRTMQ